MKLFAYLSKICFWREWSSSVFSFLCCTWFVYCCLFVFIFFCLCVVSLVLTYDFECSLVSLVEMTMRRRKLLDTQGVLGGRQKLKKNLLMYTFEIIFVYYNIFFLDFDWFITDYSNIWVARSLIEAHSYAPFL